MLTGKVGPFIRPKARSGRRPKRNLERRAARRRVLAGYPVEPRQFDASEVISYFAGDKITCLLCGKSYRSLGLHLRHIHAMDEDAYRERYGLPYRRGLTSDAAHDCYAQSISDDRIEKLRLLGDENRGKAHEAIREHGVRITKVNIDRASARIRAMNGKTFTADDYERILIEYAAHRPMRDILGRDGRPSRSMFSEWCRKNPDYRARYKAIHEALPYKVQALSQRLGPRFKEDVSRLHRDGKNDYEIAHSLGVSPMTVNRITARLRKVANEPS
jgi:hypothetical protein